MHCPLRTPQHSAQCVQRRGGPASCRNSGNHLQAKLNQARSRRRAVCVHAANTLYDALGVSQEASDRDIKRAYRQKALKLHPDVNKQPNAEQQFLAVKNAFQVLSDPQQRAQYDRQLKGGFGDFGDFGSWGGGWGSSSSSTGSRPRTKQEEEFYGLGDFLSDVGAGVGGLVSGTAAEIVKLGQQAGEAVRIGNIEDFFRDLEKEVDDWSKKRSTAGKPASLWEELAAIGEEFVDFLEQGLKDDGSTGSSSSNSSTDGGKEGSSTGGSSSFNRNGKSKSPVDAYEDLKKQYDLGGNGRSSAGSNTSSSGSTGSSNTSNSASSDKTIQPPPPPPKKTPDEDIENMLAALKKKMNKG